MASIFANRLSRVLPRAGGRAAKPALFSTSQVRCFAVEVPSLPYDNNALEPHISKETVEFHYGKHHKGYATALNGAIAGTDLDSASLEDIIMKSEGANFNAAAQIWNHNFYWKSLSPSGGGQPTGNLAQRINDSFGSFDAFKSEFTTACVKHFGSGWVWLVQTSDGKLAIHQTHDAGCPLRDNAGTPLIVCDVWEHAYYIDQRNLRPKYVEAFWELANWDFASSNMK